LVYFTVARAAPMEQTGAVAPSPFAAWLEHLANPRLRAAFGIGFCILFAFIGTFTYVNFVLVRPPLSLGPMELGFVYFVFLPSVVTTLWAGRAVHRYGTRPTLWGSLSLAGVGLPLLLLPNLAAVLLGMILIGVGTFFAQAMATGFVSRAATADRGAASGIYLACYFAGGLVGTAILGQIFDRIGWPACVAGIGLALGAAAVLAHRLKLQADPTTAMRPAGGPRGSSAGQCACPPSRARLFSTASAAAPSHCVRMASRTSAPIAGECGRPRTVTRFTSRQNSGSTSGRTTISGPSVMEYCGMKAKPRPAAAMAKIQSARALPYTASTFVPCWAKTSRATLACSQLIRLR